MRARDNVGKQTAQRLSAGRTHKRLHRDRPWYFLVPSLGALLVIALVPLCYAVYISLHSIVLTMPYLGKPFVGLQNFVDVFTTPRSLAAFGRTFLLLLMTILPQLALGLGLAWAIWRNCSIGERTWITLLLVLPMAVPKVVGGLIWSVLYDPIIGPINYLLNQLQLPALGWLSDPRLALVSVGIVDIWQWTPFMILILLAGLEGQPREIHEAARLDGATPFQQFWSIALPLLRPFVTVAVLFRALDAMRTFDYIFTLTQGGPGRATETVDLFAYAVGVSESGNISLATAAALVLLIFTIALGTFWARRMRWGEKL